MDQSINYQILQLIVAFTMQLLKKCKLDIKVIVARGATARKVLGIPTNDPENLPSIDCFEGFDCLVFTDNHPMFYQYLWKRVRIQVNL